MASALRTTTAAGAGGEQPLAIPEPPPRGPLANRGRASILLVDDDEKSLRALTHVLEPLGQNLVSARSGEEALRWLLREEFAVILLDMRMPGLDGLQTARYINARARTRYIPIIFLTAHSGDVERVFGAHAAGAVDFVSKPFEPDVLRSKVAVFVELHHARAEHVHEARARAEAEGIAATIGKLQSISDAALMHLELRDLLAEILKRSASVFEADVAGLLLHEDGAPVLALLTPDGVRRIERPEPLAAMEQALAPALEGSPMNLGELSAAQLRALPIAPHDDQEAGEGAREGDDDGGADALAERRGESARSLIAAPLAGGRDLLGVLFLSRDGAWQFSNEDMVVLRLGAERAAVAMDHARSYERERGLVELLQDHLLPDSLPRVPGLAMAARYRPSESLAQVGGDWYDAILLPDGRLGLVIGDVVGNGIAAATLMAELRAALRAYAVAEPGSPASAVAALNSLAASTHRRMVATLLYVVVDDEGGRVRFSSAGHPPPLLLGADGATHYLSQRPGAPLGVDEYTRYADFEAQIEAGSTLLLYTDGLVERRGESIDTGLARLAASLADAPAELDALCAHVLARADGGAGLHDDAALVALRRLARSANVLDLKLPAEPRSVPAARRRLSGWLAARGAEPDEIFEVALAVSEACTNAVEHAYGPERGATFRLLAERSSEAVVVRVADSGRWRPPRGAGRGRGLRVISELMDGFDVTRTATGTTVEMTKGLRAHGE